MSEWWQSCRMIDGMVKTTVRAPDDMMERLKKLAERHHRSVHGELLARLEDGIRLAERAERRREVADARQAQG
jgi:predicted transcriptional regulator